MQKISRRLSVGGKKIGLVPTMGFLHEGHISLIKRAAKLSDKVITSIFVNPAQFSPTEDLDKYPRDEKGDIIKIERAGGDVVFIPKVSEIYPDDYRTYVDIENITKSMEGLFRPTHFRGVTTIVSKLFNIIRPDIAVFGLKDYQQAIVIKTLARELNYPIKIIIGSTIREKDGLAMSSRNKYFSSEQRKEAVCLYQALTHVRRMVYDEGIRDSVKLKTSMKKIIKKVCPSAEIDYIAFTDFESLGPVKKIEKNCICSLAVRLHGIRLIDNLKI